jgi:hypothetical protein
MRLKPYMLALFLLAPTVAVGQAEQHEKSHADHLERHFDPKESTVRFDDPVRDIWQPLPAYSSQNSSFAQTLGGVGLIEAKIADHVWNLEELAALAD